METKNASKISASVIMVLILLSMMSVIMHRDVCKALIGPYYKAEIANASHSPIEIDGDTEFTAMALTEGWTGNGSSSNPFIIENLDITLGVTPVASINISNTNVHFIIRGCRLIGPGATPSYGIYLENSNNGIIVNNLITNFADGLYVTVSSTGLTASRNNISYNSYGINLEYSNGFTITQNFISGNFFNGISVHHSAGGTMSGNDCINNGNHGIFMEWSTGLTLNNNTCNENTWHGFHLYFAEGSIFENNTFNGNDIAFFANESISNYIQWNIFANSTTANAVTSVIPTVFAYNYWSDYTGSDADLDGIGDTSYIFTGDRDDSPLMYLPFPVKWANAITDQHIEFGSDFSYELPIYCQAPHDICMNDSVNFFLNDGIITSRITLPIGDYPLFANVTNIYGYRTEAIFTVVVRDATPPTITHPEDLTYRIDDNGHTIYWTASDLSPIEYSILRNGTEITSSGFASVSWFVSISVETLPAGVYNYTLTAVDTSGNMAYDTVLVTILPVPLMEILLPSLAVTAIGLVIVVTVVLIIKRLRLSKSD
jgi:parallel beta-helix repeat protein